MADTTSATLIEELINSFDDIKSNNEEKTMCIASLNPGILKAKYAVRGEIVIRAIAMEQELAENGFIKNNKKIKKIIFCSVGNPQIYKGYESITFHRQVLSLIMYPPLMNDKNILAIYPLDVIKRAKRILNYTPSNSIGAYSISQGMLPVRKTISKFIEKRDGYKSNPDNIFLTDGASVAIKYVLSCLTYKPSQAILIPCPQYPLYSATISCLNGTPIAYYLDEQNNWSFNLKSAETAIQNALSNNIDVRGMVVINPGNPTGQCLTRKDMNDILYFCNKYKLVLLADEVYQENVFCPNEYPFISFKKCLMESNLYKNIELISFFSASKGCFGECGIRGGYMELTNIDKNIKETILKLASIGLCPNTIGQCMLDLICDRPQIGDQSYALFEKEYKICHASLTKRAKLISVELNKINGIHCQKVFGAMYAFPQITFSQNIVKNILHSNKNGKTVDFIYCMELLENKGIVLVPGSGFGQKNGTYHFRTTILPPINEMHDVVQYIAQFHEYFIKKYQ